MFGKLFKKSTAKVIAEIHNEFDTATERLLSEAKEIIGNVDKGKVDKAEILRKLGFSQAKAVVEAKEEIDAEKESKAIAEAIMYYQTYYPNNKFITEKEVEKICKKYSLVCAEVGFYKGDVPEKNVKEIERFELRKEELERRTNVDDYYESIRFPALRQMSALQLYMAEQSPRYGEKPTTIIERFTKPDFKICAPIKDFDTRRMEVSKGYLLQHIPDPIVLQPVKHGYLIISKWGLEGSDESLVNEKQN